MKITSSIKVILTYILLMTTGVCLASCNNSQDQNTKEPVNNASQQSAVSTHEKTDDGLAFKDKGGNTISLSDLKGKVVFINFWATWCPPCIQEMPSIDALRKQFNGNDNIEFLMVDVDNNIDKSSAFMEKRKFDLPVYVPAVNIPSEYLKGAIPTTVILDKKGEIIIRIEGGRDYTRPELVKALKELVETK